MILIPLLTYPLVQYLVPSMIRYTEPLTWILLALAGGEAWRRINARRNLRYKPDRRTTRFPTS
ncbi:MAG: hypothetical protein SYC29_09925 [Planctomycetota bacterium]|nr:hypothetical protein [Planctomycetota bacterium]